MIIDVVRSLVDAKKILRFGGVVEGQSRPLGDTVMVKTIRRGVDVLEVPLDRSAHYHLSNSGRDDVMSNAKASGLAVVIYSGKPLVCTLKEFEAFAIAHKVVAPDLDVSCLCFFKHQRHVD